MIRNVKQFISYYTTLDEPVEYHGLKIYPIKVRDYYNFVIYSSVLNIDKDSIEDLNVIQMNYLDFLVFHAMKDETFIDDTKTVTNGQLIYEKLMGVFSLFLHASEVSINITQNKHIVIVCDGVEINAQTFDDIRKIIMYQNLIDYDDTYVNPEIKAAYDEYWATKNKDIIAPDLEHRIADFTAMTGVLKKDVLDMSYREFEMAFDAAKDKLEYQIAKTGEMSGMIKFKNPIEHWIFKRKKSKYEGVFTDYGDFKKKII